eukprot:23950_1
MSEDFQSLYDEYVSQYGKPKEVKNLIAFGKKNGKTIKFTEAKQLIQRNAKQTPSTTNKSTPTQKNKSVSPRNNNTANTGNATNTIMAEQDDEKQEEEKAPVLTKEEYKKLFDQKAKIDHVLSNHKMNSWINKHPELAKKAEIEAASANCLKAESSSTKVYVATCKCWGALFGGNCTLKVSGSESGKKEFKGTSWGIMEGDSVGTGSFFLTGYDTIDDVPDGKKMNFNLNVTVDEGGVMNVNIFGCGYFTGAAVGEYDGVSDGNGKWKH